MVDFFISSLDLWLKMNQFPQIVAVDIFRIWCPHLYLCHWYQNLRVGENIKNPLFYGNYFVVLLYLISNNLNLGCRRLTWASLKQQKLWRNHFNQDLTMRDFFFCLSLSLQRNTTAVLKTKHIAWSSKPCRCKQILITIFIHSFIT